MSEPVIAAEAADAEIASICEATGASLDKDAREHIRRALMDGRLIFRPESESFSYRFKKPIAREKSTITEITLSEPTAGQIRDATKGGRSDVESSIHLLALTSGQPLPIIEAIGQRDLAALGAILGFFG
jgi:hypothetical protein